MAARWRGSGPGDAVADVPQTNPRTPRRGEEPSGARSEDSAESLRELPRWMRLYLYGMHGVTLDVLLSSVHGLLTEPDPKLLGFSSPCMCAVHALGHLALGTVHAHRRRFPVRPAVFHLLLYPSIYLALQMLIGTVRVGGSGSGTGTGTLHLPLALHYVTALYLTLLFHTGVSTLRYRHGGELRRPEESGPLALPGRARFWFFGMQGLLDEVVFTSVFNLVETRSLRGHTSLWSFLMYGSCSAVVERLYLHLHFGRGWGTWRRLPIYICFIYTWEFCWGLALRQFGACSWDYSHYPHNFMGLITLLYLPGWVCLSLYQDVLSNVLLRVRVGTQHRDQDHVEEVNGQLQDS